MVELQMESLVVDLELKTLEVLSEVLRMVVDVTLAGVFGSFQVDFRELVLFGLKMDHPWLVEKVEVQ